MLAQHHSRARLAARQVLDQWVALLSQCEGPDALGTVFARKALCVAEAGF